MKTQNVISPKKRIFFISFEEKKLKTRLRKKHKKEEKPTHSLRGVKETKKIVPLSKKKRRNPVTFFVVP